MLVKWTKTKKESELLQLAKTTIKFYVVALTPWGGSSVHAVGDNMVLLYENKTYGWQPRDWSLYEEEVLIRVDDLKSARAMAREFRKRQLAVQKENLNRRKEAKLKGGKNKDEIAALKAQITAAYKRAMAQYESDVAPIKQTIERLTSERAEELPGYEPADFIRDMDFPPTVIHAIPPSIRRERAAE